MCGIFGTLSAKNSIDKIIQNARLVSTLHALRRRGPDDKAFETFDISRRNDIPPFELILGHTRLSVIDLSSNGHQPMHSNDGRFVVVYNGEIYNYRELREELKSYGHNFQSDSDTEVLLIAWSHWGAACLPRFTGMFAFAMFDRRDQTITCVRDAFGIKPFFYYQEDGCFSFASELPGLLELLPSKPNLNWQRSYDYLVHGDYDSTSETFYAGIHHLPPGHWLEINAATGKFTSLQRWWQPQVEERIGWRFDDAVEQVRENFLENIRFHLRSDVPIGAALSGGIDSSAVVCAMRYVEPDLDIHTFSYISKRDDINEEYWVDRVNAYVGSKSHKVSLNHQELERDIDDMISTQGEPFGSTSIYAQYRVYQLAHEKGITVTLDGQGADEMLAGYSGYPGQRLKSLLETNRFSDALNFLNNWANWPGRSRFVAVKDLISELTDGSLYEALRTIDGKSAVPKWINTSPLINKDVVLNKNRIRPETNTKGRRLIDELALSLSKRGVLSLLRHGDRNSMRFSIESRVPFLTLNMVNLLLSMPEHFLISHSGETKCVFRAAMRGIVPDEILDRRDKIGFQTPELEWFTEMRFTLRKWLSVDAGIPFLNQKEMLLEFDAVIAGHAKFSWRLWRWINFIRWYSKFFNN